MSEAPDLLAGYVACRKCGTMRKKGSGHICVSGSLLGGMYDLPPLVPTPLDCPLQGIEYGVVLEGAWEACEEGNPDGERHWWNGMVDADDGRNRYWKAVHREHERRMEELDRG